MAVQTRAEVPGMTGEMYDGMIQQLGAKIQEAPGFIIHIARPTAAGLEVVEVWETEEAVRAWLRDTIAPMMQGAGMPMPEVEFHAVHNVIRPKRG